MTLEPSAWRANDAVRFDDARDAVDTATGLLYTLADRGAIEMSSATERARDIHLRLLALDGFDRDAVNGFLANLNREIAAIAAGAS